MLQVERAGGAGAGPAACQAAESGAPLLALTGGAALLRQRCAPLQGQLRWLSQLQAPVSLAAEAQSWLMHHMAAAASCAVASRPERAASQLTAVPLPCHMQRQQRSWLWLPAAGAHTLAE